MLLLLSSCFLSCLTTTSYFRDDRQVSARVAAVVEELLFEWSVHKDVKPGEALIFEAAHELPPRSASRLPEAPPTAGVNLPSAEPLTHL